jgi:hypothetical protein
MSNKQPMEKLYKIVRMQEPRTTQLTILGKGTTGLTNTPSLRDGHLKARSTRASMAPAPAMAP